MELRENKWGVSGPVMIAVMDGVGLGKQDAGDAVFQAKTPNLDLFCLQSTRSPGLSPRRRSRHAE